MTAVVCFELIPEAFEMGGMAPVLTGITSGIVVIILIEGWISKSGVISKNQKGNARLLRAGILMAIALSLHNFPEGFAVGSGFEASLSLGIAITLVIVIHDIPEGIAMALPLRVGGYSRRKAFGLTFLSGTPMGLGALFGAILGGISKQWIAGCLGFSGGAMLYVVFGELVPESKRLYFGRLSSVGNIIGILCGMLVSIYSN
jgi:ZIP family zinc transporter